jgi:hypothetical protein
MQGVQCHSAVGERPENPSPACCFPSSKSDDTIPIMKFAKVIVLGLVAAALSACSGSKPSAATTVPTTTGGYVQPAK